MLLAMIARSSSCTRMNMIGYRLTIEAFRAGQDLSERLLINLSVEERAMLEVCFIEALTNWPAEERQRLRSMLMKVSYDDLCARRAMKESLSNRIRALTLLRLLRRRSTGQLTGPLPFLIDGEAISHSL
jgi:hypothetical protein